MHGCHPKARLTEALQHWRLHLATVEHVHCQSGFSDCQWYLFMLFVN